MRREVLTGFLAGFVIFGVWTALRRWDLLVAVDIGIIAVQAVVPLFSLVLSTVAIMRPSTTLPRSAIRLFVAMLLGYPIWVAAWLLSMLAVERLVDFGVSPELLNNSQVFLGSYVAEVFPTLTIVGVMGVVVWVVRRRQNLIVAAASTDRPNSGRAV